MLFFQVYLICICISIVGELINYKLLYSTSKYNSLKKNIIVAKKKLELEEADSSSNVTKQKRKIAQVKAQLELYAKESSTIQLRALLISSVLQFFFMYIIGSVYENRVIAKLPFTPMYFFQGFTHRGLEGEDFTQCSALFVFILNSMSAKPIIDNLFGFSLPKVSTGRPEWVTNPEGFVNKFLSK
ncbi:hypothetical protein BB561_002935 [Smittium simulii]|uniref:Calcium load-activated calcium channel n=1 Tax=Smittium simulii TaxID=133385 RepID=A0A2T9YNM8_9FUNG|nr:hypothetical protein BB561_002935 [Smittium simulii]